jgi:branched-chain amino acid transport system permease protein
MINAGIAAALADGVLLGLIYALLGLGLGLVLGFMGVVNTAHGAFVMLGSFLAYELFRRFGIDPVVSLVLALPLFFAVGFLVYHALVRRVEHGSGLLAMFGLMVLLESLGTIFWTNDSRVIAGPHSDRSIALGGIALAEVRLLAGGLALVLIGSVWAFLRFTLTGRAIRAIGQNRAAASALGIDASRLSATTFGLGIACAGAAGTVLAMVFPFSPNTQVQWLPWAFLVAILGGLGNIANLLAAGLVIGLLQTLCTAWLPFDYVYLALYLLLAAILIVRREGLGGAMRRAP